MLTYSTIVTAGDFGPHVSKLVLALPEELREGMVDGRAFNVFATRTVRATGEVLLRQERGAQKALPSVGYVEAVRAYPCTPDGTPTYAGSHVVLELPECRLTKTIEGGVLGSRCLDNRYRVTLVEALCGAEAPLVGLVWDEKAGETCPEATGWHEARTTAGELALGYGYFEPDFAALDAPGRTLLGEPCDPVLGADKKVPLVLWLHGAGEGEGDAPGEVERAYLGNRVTALSQPQLQARLGGAAYVLVPQSPTVWMDTGTERLGTSNQSVYTASLKALVDEFVAAHPRVDADRIIVGGLSNGGFMTCRLLADYPGFFSCGLACCAPWFVESETPEELATLAKTPIWFVHAKGDELVPLERTALPLYHELVAAGGEAHFTLFDHVEDLTGVHKEPDGRNLRTFNHGVWIHVYNDQCDRDLDGSTVQVDGRPVTCWEWAGAQVRTER